MSEQERKDAVTEAGSKPENPPPPEPEKDEPPKSYKRISFALSVVLIFAGIVTMLTSWEVLGIKIYRQGNKIIAAEFNRNQADLISRSSAQQSQTIYASYFINSKLEADLDEALIKLEDLEAEESDDFDQATYDALSAYYNDASSLSTIESFYFPKQYLRADGSYDFEQNRAEIYASVANQLETDSDKIIEETRDMQQRKLGFMEATRFLGLSIAILGFEKVFYWKRRVVRLPIILVGLAMLVAGFLQYVSLNPDPLTFLF